MKLYYAYSLTFLSMAANAAATTSCFTGTETAAGSTTVYPFAVQWAASYSALCPKATVSVAAGGSGAGAKQVCGAATPAVDIGMMSRNWKSSEAALQSDGYTFNCLIGDTNRSVAQMPVSNDAVVLIVKDDQLFNYTAAACIKKLGCLTKDQLRWMFTNFTDAQLTASGWNSSALANSDGSDATHKWSELDSSCPAVEIAIVGTDSTSGEYDFFKTTILTGTSEGFRSTYVPKTNHSDVNTYVVATPGAIGFNDFHTALSTNTTYAVPIKNPTSSACVTANATTVGDGDYAPLGRLTYMNVLKSNCTALTSGLAYIEYGYTTAGQKDVVTAGGVPLTSAQISTGSSRITTLRAGCP
jgi:ABC-type phosphate transport system substrate-binding protein